MLGSRPPLNPTPQGFTSSKGEGPAVVMEKGPQSDLPAMQATDADMTSALSTAEAGKKEEQQHHDVPDLPMESAPSYSRASEEDINYKTLEWWQAGVVMIAETVSLGILSLPAVVANLGLVPGIILMIIFGFFSTYSGLVMGEFRQKYPWVQSFGDAGEVIGRSIGMGRFFQEFLGWAQTIFVVFVMGSHLLTWTICLNTLSNSSACTVVWAVVGMAVFFLLNLPRTLKFAGYYSFVCKWATAGNPPPPHISCARAC